MKTIAITIEEDILDRIDRLTAKEGKARNRSSIIRRAVREHLDRMDRVAEQDREKAIFRRHRRQLQQQAKALVKEQAEP